MNRKREGMAFFAESLGETDEQLFVYILMGVLNEDKQQTDIGWVTNLVTRAHAEGMSAIEFGAFLKKRITTSGCNEQQYRAISSMLLRFATASVTPDQRMLSCLEALVKAEVLRWAVFIEVIAEFRQFSREYCIEALATILRNSVPLLKCNYTSEKECLELSGSLMTVLNWCLLALEYSLKNENKRSTQALIHCACAYANSKFVRALLYIHEHIGAESVNYVVEAAVSFAQSYPDCEELKTMTEALQQFDTSPAERIEDNLGGLVKQSHPAILTLVSVFEGFRMTKKVDQMADSFFELAEILEFPFPKMFEDMIRASLLIMLDAKESLGEELVASQAFYYVKLPQIVKHLLILGAPLDDLITALNTICDNKTLLNQVDMKTKTNTFQHLLEQMAAAGVINEGVLKNLLEKRSQYWPELFQMLAQTSTTPVHQPLILRANSAKMAVDKILRQPNNAVINVLLKLASGSGGLFTFDSVCASFCADGNLTYFSAKLAMINGQSERPAEGLDMDDERQRALAFNLSFILLTRIRFIYDDLRPSELVNGTVRGMDNTQSCFFKFASQYGWTAADSCGLSNTYTNEQKAAFVDRVNILKRGQPFWDPRTVNYAELVDFIPVIGEILLDDFRMTKFENYEHLHENIKNVLHAFRDDANFMIVCLVQWMCSQPVTNPRQSLVKSFIRALEYPHQLNHTQQERMVLTSATCRRTLDDLSICDRLRDPRFTWIINCAKRKLPTVPFTLPATNAQSSDAEMLKQAFTYARQQAWGSPNVLQLVDRCNKAGVVENWCMVWLNAMLKLSTNDEMLCASELCLAAGIMSPVPCMLSFARSITEYIFEQNVDFGCVEPKALVSARFLVHCLQLAMHAYWRQQKERQARIVRGECVEKKRSDVDDDGETDQGNPVERSVLVIFEKFVRETRAGHLKSTITFIYHFVVSLATAPPNAATRRIIELLPHDLMLNLARLDPQTFNLDLYLPLMNLCDIANTKSALQFTCLLRKLGGF
ncbi:unnamed protein product [Onchocerca ochengi]|uniref:Mediator of RNA polymerase II transcription subunit 24 n=2 Tax=Onchocerca TaxID=6281 RepID=A0A182E2Q1_ONCOC|nr:unnamed protein product [Onchocerca ochengi]